MRQFLAVSNAVSEDRSQRVADIQRKYLENINSDALIVACISELSGTLEDSDLSAFGRMCAGLSENPDLPGQLIQNDRGLIQQIARSGQEQLRDLKARSSVGHAVDLLAETRAELALADCALTTDFEIKPNENGQSLVRPVRDCAGTTTAVVRGAQLVSNNPESNPE